MSETEKLVNDLMKPFYGVKGTPYANFFASPIKEELERYFTACIEKRNSLIDFKLRVKGKLQ